MCKFILAVLLLTITVAAEPCSTEFVASPIDQIRIAMKLARVVRSDVVYDLGSGDGVVVITAAKEFAARRAVGVELQSRLVAKSRQTIQALKLPNAVIVKGDFFKTDIRAATVIYVNLPCARDAVEYACKAAPRARVLVTGNQVYPSTTLLKHSYSMEGGVSLFQCER